MKNSDLDADVFCMFGDKVVNLSKTVPYHQRGSRRTDGVQEKSSDKRVRHKMFLQVAGPGGLESTGGTGGGESNGEGPM